MKRKKFDILTIQSRVAKIEKRGAHNEEWWHKYWIGMPEFIQKDFSPYCEITVAFPDQLSMDLFFEAINKKYSRRTKRLWFPSCPRKNDSALWGYIDEDDQ